MTPEQLAARWLAAVQQLEAKPVKSGEPYIIIRYADALAAIARHLAPGDDLVERAEAALEGVTEGKPCQFHPSYCKEAEGTPFSEWDSSHDLSVILPNGKRYKIGHFRHSADAGFDQFARQWVPEAAARISALTATVERRGRMHKSLSKRFAEANSARKAAEAEATTLRARLARMEGERDDALSAAQQQDRLREATLATLRGVSADLEASETKAARLLDALTPSGDTKAAYMGEFSIPFPTVDENGNEVMLRPNVPWTTIKEIMAAIRARAALTDGGSNG